MSYLSLLGLISQILVVLISVFFYKKYKSKFSKMLCVVLIINLISELMGVYCKYAEINSFNIYYLYTGVVFIIISVMYTTILEKTIWLIFLKLLSFVFLVYWGCVFVNKELFTYLIIFGSINTSLFVFLYLKELLQSNEIINYKKLLPFWVSVGFLAFYLPSIPFFTMYRYMENRGLFFILNILIILMNIFITYGLLCSTKEEKY